MTFEQYWNTEGCRHFSEHHQDRAKHAWDALNQERQSQLRKARDMIDNLGLPGDFSTWIAIGDAVEEINGMINAN